MHHQQVSCREAIPIEAAPPDGEHTENSILAGLLLKYGPVLSFAELLEATKVSRSTADNFKNQKHKRFDPLYPKGSPIFESTNSPHIFSSPDAAKWLFARLTRRITSKKV